MSLTRGNSYFFNLGSVFLFALVFVAATEGACAQGGAGGGTGGGFSTGGGSVGGATVTVNGKTIDDREITISLNPCKGETPGNVLGVSERLETPQRVSAFVGKLRDADPKARACAARHLGYIGQEARDALPHIIRRMREDEHSGVGVNLSEALWAIGPDARGTLDEWMASSKAGDAEVRFYAAFALGYYKPLPSNRKRVVAALADAAADKDGGVQWVAVRGLMRLGPDAADAVPALLVILHDEKGRLRHLAASALGNIGPAAEAAAPGLLKLLYTTQDYTLYVSASFALARIGAPVVPLLAKDLKTDKTLRILDILRHMKPHGAPLIVEALGMENHEVLKKACEAIQWYGPEAAPAVPLLVKLLKSNDKDLRHKAAFTLYTLGRVSKEAAPALSAALGDKEDMVQCYAAKALGALGPKGASAVPELRRLMALPEGGAGVSFAQRCAAEALIEMGPETKALVPPEMLKKVEEFNRVFGDIGRGDVDETKPKPKEKKAAPPPGW